MKRSIKIPLLLAVIGLLWFLPRSGAFLVRDQPLKSDVMVVAAGGLNDARYAKALDLLRAGYAPLVLLDASADMKLYGRSFAEMAQEYAPRQAGPLASQVKVCPIYGDSTLLEAGSVARCLEPLHPARVMVVTSDFHTRRARSIFQRRMPQYQWSSAAAADPYFFGTRWWTHREWAKTNLLEWQRLLWWELVERWKN
jgi:hypothetical protein